MTLPDHTPDYDHGYLRIPLSVWSGLYCQAPLTRRQLQLVSYVLRELWGWQTKAGQVYRWTRPLTPRQFSAATGLSTDHLTQDLQQLVARGLLLERERRYQLVSNPTLWKTRLSLPQKPRPEGVETAATTAKPALSSSVLKKANKEERNVARLPENELSPTGDNFPPPAFPSTAQRRRLGQARIRRRSVGHADRLVPLLESFVGPLPPTETQALQARMEAVGVVPVWDALEPFFRQGRGATRQQLQRFLSQSIDPRGDVAAPLSPGVPHG